MQPVGKAHTMLQITITLFTHLFKKKLLVFYFFLVTVGHLEIGGPIY